MKYFVLLTLILSSSLFANTTDKMLRAYVKGFKIKALKAPTGKNEDLFKLGEALFFEKALSGNKNVSCATCHDPQKGTGDGLPLPVGVTPQTIIPRNSPALYNVGDKSLNNLFWDARVSYNKKTEVFITPSEGLNGDYPQNWEITENLHGALAAQALFPLLSHEEMRGVKGTNPIANAKTDKEAWALILKRVLSLKKYKRDFSKVFPNEQLNISHLANALAHYQKHEFSRVNTPWDKYLRGDSFAMSLKEKRGAIIFLEEGRCFACHNGDLLGGNMMANIAAPQIGPGFDRHKNDQGRFEFTKNDRDKYMFRVPPLRNVALTAPYFHSGSIQTLKEVLNHYNQGLRSLDKYNSNWLKSFENSIYKQEIFVETNHYRLFKKKENAHPIIKGHAIRLNSSQQSDLLMFLSKSLTDLD